MKIANPSKQNLASQRLERLSELARKVAAKTISASEKEEHDTLLCELSEVNPWLNNLRLFMRIKELLFRHAGEISQSEKDALARAMAAAFDTLGTTHQS